MSDGNPAADHGAVPDTKSRSGFANHVGPTGMGTEGGSQGIITMLNVVEESLPPNTRTVNEPDGEWLK